MQEEQVQSSTHRYIVESSIMFLFVALVILHLHLSLSISFQFLMLASPELTISALLMFFICKLITKLRYDDDVYPLELKMTTTSISD